MATWNLSGTQQHMLICNGSTCTRHGAEEVTQEIRETITKKGADGRIHTTRTRCNGRCDDGCVVIVYPQGVWYGGVTAEDAASWMIDDVLFGRIRDTKAVYTYDPTQHTMQATGNSTSIGERKNNDA